jgi:hypothetical protein
MSVQMDRDATGSGDVRAIFFIIEAHGLENKFCRNTTDASATCI